MREGKLPFQDWFDTLSYRTLGAIKSSHLFMRLAAPEVAPSFEDFRGWLLVLQISFACGFITQRQQWLPLKRVTIEGPCACGGGTSSAFDEETLGGHVTYSAVVNPTRHLTGELEGLV